MCPAAARACRAGEQACKRARRQLRGPHRKRHPSCGVLVDLSRAWAFWTTCNGTCMSRWVLEGRGHRAGYQR